MRLSLKAMGLLVLIVESLTAQATIAQEPTNNATVKPLMTLYGQHSKITKPKKVRITSDREWKALWSEHQLDQSRTRAELDFSRVMVIAIFQGDGMLYGGYDVERIIEGKDRLTVRVRPLYFQVSVSASVDVMSSKAWGIFVLPLSDKQIVIEGDERKLIDSPYRWVKWTMFPAIPSRDRR